MTKHNQPKLAPPPKTGWGPGMLQDDCRALSIWLANRIDSRRHAREAVQAILKKEEHDQLANRPARAG